MMKVVKLNTSRVTRDPAPNPLFLGPVVIERLLTKDNGKSFKVGLVCFEKGNRTKFHAHDTDQLLWVKTGRGIVMTDDEKIMLEPGELVFIPAGLNHWHGAPEDSYYEHISFLPVDCVETTNE